ncbi:hypothetical protein [Paenibacillus paridis]|uniref:hypothetical protein n=1 Tax=Paenibacillus paridis TaxID=2583376 RepID=UPI001123708A|nr:hypothetical protein [Paenibacillus paridis]
MKKIALLWRDNISSGSIVIEYGKLEHGEVKSEKGHYDHADQSFCLDSPGRLELTVCDENVNRGAFASIITIRTSSHSFSFFLRDVSYEYPIYIKEYGVVVTEAAHSDSYEQMVERINNKGMLTNLQLINAEPEESFEQAASASRPLTSPIWLGLSRDVRLFESDFRGMGDNDNIRAWDCVRPRYPAQINRLPETADAPVLYYYLLGRGIGSEYRVTRSLEDRIYPIALCTIHDDDIRYDNVAFVSYESSPLTAQSLQGTHYLAADQYGVGFMFTQQQQEQFEKLPESQLHPAEETVYYSKTTATNFASVPRYAWFKNPAPMNADCHFEGDQGFGVFSSDRVFVISKLDGQPLPQEEVAVLLKPGETVTFEFFLPHSPVTRERANRLAEQDFASRHEECLSFWQEKLERTTKIQLPEPRIEEMMQAGFLHLDLVCYGLEPDQTLVPTIGVYTAIGSESSPIMQYLDSMGAHDLAERSLQFFLDKQHEDGFIQNFNGYMLETGAALFGMGEHYRYVRDVDWLLRIKPKLLKAYEYLMGWRSRNLREELRGQGYGMLEGKTADPEDPFRSYMLNGFAYVGLKRLAEMLEIIDEPLSIKIGKEAEQLKRDIQISVKETMENSPVVPLGDGSWVPTCAPWANYRGPVSLYADGGKWGTHGSMVVRDSLLGPLYLVIQEVLEPDSLETGFLLNFHNELMCMRNVALSQPYYSVHPWIHLKRGETKLFLKAFYNGVAGLADRETYTFWEHYFHVSPHKTHEEGWFLMQCRWMLYMEEKQALRLLPGIPRAWLEQGKKISVRHAASYFGHFSMEIQSDLSQGRITADIEFHSDRRPAEIAIRLPHPSGQRALRTNVGNYDADTETVIIAASENRVQVVLEY